MKDGHKVIANPESCGKCGRSPCRCQKVKVRKEKKK